MSLIELLDRLSKLRPALCKHRPDYHIEFYELHDGEDWIPCIPSKVGKRHLSQIKGAIERAIEAEIDKPGNLWTGYVAGQSLADGKFARIYSPEFPYNPDADRWAIERRMQENQAIALLGCLIACLELE